MTTTRDVIIKVKVAAESALSGLGAVNTSFTEMNQALELGKKALAAFNSSFTFLDQAQKIAGVTRGFEDLQTQAGLLADHSLGKLRVATQGLITDFDLMQQANQAVQLGLDPTKLDIMAEASGKLGAAVGRTANEALADLITGVGRASPLILDNLGITVKAAEAQTLYAAKLGKATSQLTENEKAEAFRAAALDKIIEKSETLSGIEENAAAASQQLRVAVSNQVAEVQKAILENDDLANTFRELTQVINDIDTDAIVDLFNTIVSGAKEAIGFMNELSQVYRVFVTPLEAAKDKVIDLAQEKIKLAKTEEDLIELLRTVELAYKDVGQTLEETAKKHGFDAQQTQLAAGEHKGYAEAIDLVRTALLESIVPSEQIIKKTTEVGEAAKKAGKDFKTAFDDIDDILKALDLDDGLSFGGFDFDKDFEKEKAAAFKLAEESAKKLEASQKEAYENGVSFYEDIFEGAVEGNLEQVLESMFRRTVIKFAAQLAASLTGFEGFSLGGGGGGFDYGSIIDAGIGYFTGGSGAAASGIGPVASGAAYGANLGAFAGTTGIGPVASGSAYGAAISGSGAGASGAAAGGAALGAAATTAGVGIIAAAYANAISNTASDLTDSNNSNDGQAAVDAALYASGIGAWIPVVTQALGIDYGITAGKDPDQKMRDAFRAVLEEAKITNNYQLPVFGGGSFDIGGGEEVGGFASNLAHSPGDDGQAISGAAINVSTLIGGDASLAGNLSHAFDAAENFNAAMLTAQGILVQLGHDAESAGDAFVEMFLGSDGSLEALEEFNNAMNINAQIWVDDLANVEESAELLAIALDGKPLDAIQAMALHFQEMEQAGVSGAENITNFMIERFPQAEGAIRAMTEGGIDSFEDFADLTATEMQLLINVIFQMNEALSGTERSARSAGTTAKSSFHGARVELGRYKVELQSVVSLQNEASSSGGGGEDFGVQG